MKSIRKNDSNEINSDKLILKKLTLNEDKVIHEDCSRSEKHLSQNNELPNAELNQEQHVSNELDETLSKTSSRPQRQAAKKAESQIRVNKHMVINRYNI